MADGTGIALSTLKRRLLGAPFTLDEIGLIAEHFGTSITDVITPMGDRIAQVEKKAVA